MRAAANGFARPLSAVTPRAPVAAAPAALQMALAAVHELNPGGQRGRSVEARLCLPVLDPAGHVAVDRDICFLLNAFAIEPGSATPRVMTMLGFNIWCWNSRVFPGIDNLPVHMGERSMAKMGEMEMPPRPTTRCR